MARLQANGSGNCVMRGRRGRGAGAQEGQVAGLGWVDVAQDSMAQSRRRPSTGACIVPCPASEQGGGGETHDDHEEREELGDEDAEADEVVELHSHKELDQQSILCSGARRAEDAPPWSRRRGGGAMTTCGGSKEKEEPGCESGVSLAG